ncbi:hypothetical protein [Acetivibrio clariflavus]|uniref:DUF5050 domain-containing protein n=1 Tax=Acetivibrio clariflavus (strain DSM 19732 / NBRC 101661 / EBR45) TaxID=720554 RepID=G8M1H4_ACECE|nr:hypothetical protein [Acetivibrio clariflavus]AEV69189.1 hypothetical protein Clocl_2623 [Acetivibrio clariflavus DSM 19732]
MPNNRVTFGTRLNVKGDLRMSNDSYSLYRMDFDGNEIVRFSKTINILEIKVIGQYVFFITKDGSLYKIDIWNGKECRIV